MKKNSQKKILNYNVLAMSLLCLYGTLNINNVIAAPLLNLPNVPLEANCQVDADNKTVKTASNSVYGNNTVFTASYRVGAWDGDIVAKSIDPNTGIINNNIIWSGKDSINNKVSLTSDTRTIYYSSSKIANKTRLFEWNNLTDSEKKYFKNKCTSLTQCNTLSAAEKNKINNGEDLFYWLRGQSSNNNIFREREYVLGDIVNSTPIYVGEPKYDWTDEGYQDYKLAYKDRKKMLYVGANDGMIHAFDANTGENNWSLIPNQVMSKMHKLADRNYKTNHNFYINGQFTVMDAKIGNEWKTILIGALERGGQGYIAVDVTNPDIPNVLWEFCGFEDCTINDSHLGYTYGNPIITKRFADDKWVAYVTSGYDSYMGHGVVYEIELDSGKNSRKYTINATSANDQIGLSKINASFDNFQLNNRANNIYAGDLNGNIWKINLKDKSLSQLGTAIDSLNNRQPITTKIELGKINNNVVLFFGTGQYLNENDLSNQNTQSFYAIKDSSVSNNYYDVFRYNSNLIEQTITATEDSTSESSNEIVDWDLNSGWWFDFNSEIGERMNIDPVLTMGTLNIVTNVPSSNVCDNGNSWYYQVDYKTGGSISKNKNVIANKLNSGLSSGQNIIFLKGSSGFLNLITDVNGNIQLSPIITNSSSNRKKVSSWKEILKQK